MTAQSDDANPKRTIKASAGAWWNTKVEDKTKEKAVEEKPVVKKAAVKKPSVKKPAVKKPAVKKVAVKKPVVEETVAPQAVTQKAPAQEVVAEKVVVEKPKRPRRPRKKPQDVEPAQEMKQDSKEVPTPKATPEKKPTAVKESKVTPEKVSEKAVSEPSVESATAEEKPTPKPRQRRRPNRSRNNQKNAPQDAANTPVEQTPVVEPEVHEAKTTDAASTEEAPKKRPSRRRSRSGRKPKAKIEAEQAEIAQAAQAETPAQSDPKEDVAGTTPPVAEGAEAGEETPKRTPRKRSRRSRKRKPEQKEGAAQEESAEVVAEPASESKQEAKQVSESRESKWKNVPEETKSKNIRLLINAEEPEECRLALLEDGRLQSIHVTTVARTQTKSNIYKAKVVAIEPNLQAAFVDYGTPKNGFLPFSEIHPEYFKSDLSKTVQDHVENRRWKKLKIEDVLERGQELLVQVVKEEVGKKGANMTTYLSLPGRCVVLMPGSDSAGISRKISGEDRRGQLRDIMRSMEIPEGIGWIVRTASVDITEAALQRDITYLVTLWEEIRAKGQSIENVGLAYEDHRSVLRFLREHFDPSIQEILVDAQAALDQVNEFVSMLPANQQNVKVRLHKGSRPIFNQFSVEDQIESIYQPQVNLPSGGSIVIDPTEALVAIDVNSGSTSKGKNFEESIFQANMEAASELARQLRLRDLGGLVVVDFIDMRNKRHIREVEREVKVAMKRDKAKVDFSRISKFGLMQISRQKLGSPIEAGAYRVCTHCKGRGIVRAVETLALFYLRRIQTGASRNPVVKVECRFPLDVASYLLNNKRQELSELEGKYEVDIIIIADTSFRPSENDIVFHRQEKEKDDEK